MLEKNEKPLQEAYVSFLAQCVQKLAAKNVPHFLLCHQKDDIEVVDLLEAQLGHRPYVSLETNPLYIKGILGTCRFLIGSRYHGLINGLSQGVPCIGTSWSHKYQALFEDYHCSEFLITDFTTMEKANQLIDRLLDDKEYTKAKSNIENRGDLIKQEAINMWNIVDSFLHGIESGH
jgi:colanic acid/amylovoran biosynthesis protein